MAAAKTNNDSNKSNEYFYKGENRLFHADSVTNNTTGVTVEISNSLEKLYNYMLNQYLYRKSHEQKFAESKERLGTIARIGDPKKNTKAQIDNLISLGLVEIIGKVARCDVYRVNLVDDAEVNLTFNYKSVNGMVTYDHSARIGSAREGTFKPADNANNHSSDECTAPTIPAITIEDLITEILEASTGEYLIDAVKEVIDEQVKKSSHYDNPENYGKLKDKKIAFSRFDKQTKLVMYGLVEKGLEKYGLDEAVKLCVAEMYQEAQEYQELQEEGKSAIQEAAPLVVGQLSGVESNYDSGGDDLTVDAVTVNQGQQNDDNDPTFPPKKKDPADRAGLDVLPWEGGAFEGSGRLSENAYQWARLTGTTDWRDACRMVWEKVGVTPQNEINEDRKPLSLC